MSYGNRLQEAMTKAGLDRAAIARKLGISVAAVGLVVNGKTKMFDAANHSAACELFGCRPVWLATGEGDMLSAEGSSRSLVTQSPSSTNPAALLQALATHLNQVDPTQRAALGAMFNAWVLAGGTPGMTAVIAEMVTPPEIQQTQHRRAA